MVFSLKCRTAQFGRDVRSSAVLVSCSEEGQLTVCSCMNCMSTRTTVFMCKVCGIIHFRYVNTRNEFSF